MSKRHLAMIAVAVAALLPGCGATPASATTAAPPVKVCDQTLFDAAIGIRVFSFTHPGTYNVVRPFSNPGSEMVIKCVKAARGASTSWSIQPARFASVPLSFDVASTGSPS